MSVMSEKPSSKRHPYEPWALSVPFRRRPTVASVAQPPLVTHTDAFAVQALRVASGPPYRRRHALALDDCETEAMDHHVVHLRHLTLILDPDVVQDVEPRVLTEVPVQVVGHLTFSPTTGRSPRITLLAIDERLQVHALKVRR